MQLTGQQRIVVALAALAVVVGVAAFDAENESTEPVAIVGARLGAGDRVEVVIDRCASEAQVMRTSLAEERLVVEVSAKPGSGDCRDVVDVATVTDDILAVEDATSGEVFVVRVVPPERANRPPGTRE